eukprot:TRINITY_DN80_c0_g1_i11.p2 TRINITY_DN80_c0_g1~~TRINITY_DN80_c0_g1_i11.p2  ORF type:complete len:119 (+),score=38.72 TRINITY_DN80_c0_g1_i11:217-573(+)
MCIRDRAWTDERIDQLKKLWDDGLSASQIAKELGEGVTRNAVIGKAHRLGLKSRPSPVKTCLLYTSDAADDLLCVDLGGRRIIKKKKKIKNKDINKRIKTKAIKCVECISYVYAKCRK